MWWTNTLVHRLNTCRFFLVLELSHLRTPLIGFKVTASLKEMTKKQEMLSASITVASVDNIDKNIVYAPVTSRQECRGFHGTSVQVVEPLPLSSCSNIPRPISTNPQVSGKTVRRNRSLSSDILQSFHHPTPYTLPQARMGSTRFHLCG